MKPWSDIPHVFKDEKSFCQWLRSQSRNAWKDHPIRNELIKLKRERKPIGKKTKSNPEGFVWANICEICNEATREPETDHKNQCGATGSIEEWKIWQEKLLIVGFDDLQILCKKCHAIKSYQDKMGIPFAEAVKEKECINFGKKTPAQQVEILSNLGISAGKTKEARKKQYRQYLEDNNNDKS